MKITLLIILTHFVFGIAQASNDNSNCGLTDYVDKYLKVKQEEYQNIIEIKDLNEEELISVRNKLCVYVMHASNVGFNPEKFRNIIFNALELDPLIENNDQIISDFLNKYNSKLICPRNTKDLTSRDLHLYKIAVDNGVIDLFDFLLDVDKYRIDFNAYEMVDGKKETLIDFIEAYIIELKLNFGNKDNDQLSLLVDDIIDAGAKRGSEL